MHSTLHKWGRLGYWVVVIMALSSCWAYFENSGPATPLASSTILPRLTTHSTLPLRKVWQKDIQKIYETEGSDAIPSSSIFVAQQDTLYVITKYPAVKDAFAGLKILALDPQTGQQRWASEQMGFIHSLTASPTTLFVASIDGIKAYDATTGKEKWVSNQPPPQHEGYTISFDDTTLNFIISQANHFFYTQIDPTTGLVGNLQESDKALTKIDSRYRYTWNPLNTLWLEDIQSNQAEQIVSLPRGAIPLREKNILVIPYLERGPRVWHSIMVIDLLTKQKLWECQECFASDAAIDNGKLFAIRHDGALAEYDLRSGQLIGTLEFSGGGKIDPDNTLYSIAAANGYVFLYFGGTQELTAFGPKN